MHKAQNMEAFYKDLLSHLPYALAVVHTDGLISYTNKAFAQLFSTENETTNQLCGQALGCTYFNKASTEEQIFRCAHCEIKKIIALAEKGQTVKNRLFNKNLNIHGETKLHLLSVSSVLLSNNRLLMIFDDQSDSGREALKYSEGTL